MSPQINARTATNKNVIDEPSETQQSQGNAPRAPIAPPEDIEVVIGKTKDPSHRFFVFSDPNCPFCKKTEPQIEQLAREGYEVHIFPTPVHEQSKPLINGMACAKNKTEAWKQAIGEQRTDYPSCDSHGYERSLQFFTQFGFNATPTIVNNAGFIHSGAFNNIDELKSFLEKTKNDNRQKGN